MIIDYVLDRIWVTAMGLIMLIESPALVPFVIPPFVLGCVLNILDATIREVRK